MGGFKWVVLANRMGWDGFYVNMNWSGLGGLKWILYAKQYDYIEPDPRNKTLRSHYKILSKLTEICCMTQYD